MRLGGLILVCGLVLAAMTPVMAQQTAGELPGVLPGAEIERYQRIFDFQADGDWVRANREMAALKDRLLVGHLLHQRYTHPGYNAGYAELTDWLSKYRDHAGADELYRQALKKKGRKDKAPAAPLGMDLGDYAGEQPGQVATTRRIPQPKDRDPAHRHAIVQAEAQFNSLLKRERLGEAEAFLNKADIKSKLSATEYDDWRRRLAWISLLEGQDDRALSLAAPAAQRSRTRLSEPDWVAGLAAWRLGRYDNAAHHFENLAFSKTATSWEKSAGAWWGARVMLRLRQPSEAIRLLEIGANQERTFYGQLSLAQLGTDQPLRWTPPPLDPAEARKLSEIPAIRRALALSEVGEAVRADREILRLFAQSSDQLAGALLGLVSRMQAAPASSMKISIAWYTVKGEGYDSALYPLPPWEPEGGFSVDRALVFAFMRQESAFNARAMSTAGATGLMQLMPRTAGAVAGDKSLHHKTGRHKLFAPEYNIELGQRYLQHLLDMPMIKGNLLYLAAAYNAGPGNLQKWLRANPDIAADPFLFIETIPLGETRNFVQRVLTNYWIYRSRIGQPDTSITATMTGGWPVYSAFDRGDQRAEKKN
jgi:soluble lytic murein transglycosylase-like protein